MKCRGTLPDCLACNQCILKDVGLTCSGFLLTYHTYYNHTGVQYFDVVQLQSSEPKDQGFLTAACMCGYRCWFAVIYLFIFVHKNLVLIFSPAVTALTLASWAIKVSFSHSHTHTRVKFHPASSSYHKYPAHFHLLLSCDWLRLLCPLTLYRMFDLFWLLEQAGSSWPDSSTIPNIKYQHQW